MKKIIKIIFITGASFLPIAAWAALPLGKDFQTALPRIITLAIGLGGAVAVIMLIVSGILWTISESIPAKTRHKEKAINAIYGMILLLGAFLILRTINPNILQISLEPPEKLAPGTGKFASPTTQGKPTLVLARWIKRDGTPINSAPLGSWVRAQITCIGACAGQELSVEFRGDLPGIDIGLSKVGVIFNSGCNPDDPNDYLRCQVAEANFQLNDRRLKTGYKVFFKAKLKSGGEKIESGRLKITSP